MRAKPAPRFGRPLYVRSGASLPLASDTHFVSLSSGGAQNLELAAPGSPGLPWLVLGSASGTSPGVPLGNLTLPLVPDPYFLFTALHLSTPPLESSTGILPRKGTALSRFAVPPGTDPSFAGLLLHHVGVVFDPGAGTAVLATNPVPLTLAP